MALNFQTITKGLGLSPQASAPSSPRNGDFYYDSTLQKFRFYQNSAWIDIDTGTGVVKARVTDTVSAALPSLPAALVVDNKTIVNGDRILYTALSGGPKVYKATESGGSVTALTAQADFDGSSSPSDGDFVYVQEGDYYADNLFLYDGVAFKSFLNNKTSVSLLAAQTNTVFVELDSALFENMTFEYSISNGSNRRGGLLHMQSNGSSVDLNDVPMTAIGDVGVVFSAVMSGANIQLRYTTSAGACVMKRTARIW